MKNKNLITKIALGVAIAAFVFSVVTLIRNIVLGTMVVLGVIQVVGTALVLAICVFLMVMVKRYDDMQEEGSDEDSDEEPDDEQTEEDIEAGSDDLSPTEDLSAPELSETEYTYKEENAKYDFSLFEDE